MCLEKCWQVKSSSLLLLLLLSLLLWNQSSCYYYSFWYRFDPEHFGSCALQGKDTLVFSPFGMGRRKCPGYVFSYVEVGIFMTILMQQFSLKPVGGVVKPVGMVHGLVTCPSEPLHYTVHPIAWTGVVNYYVLMLLFDH